MKWLYALGGLALFSAKSVFADEEASSDEDHVLVGSKSNFDEYLLAKKYNLVEFYAPWCGHCKALAGPFKEAAAILKEKTEDVALIKVDATAETELADRFQVQGYPTLLWFVNGINSEYEGPRTAQGIVEWVQEHMLPSLRESTEAELKEALAARTPAEGAFVFTGDDEVMKKFATDAAEELRGVGTTYFVPGEKRSLTVYTGQDESSTYEETALFDEWEKRSDADKESGKKQVITWVKTARVPLFGQITEENYEIYVDVARNGMFWVCLEPSKLEEELKSYVPIFQRAGKAMREKGHSGAMYPMVWIDAKEFEAHAKEELGCTSFPTIVLQKGDLLGDAETTKVDKYVRSFSAEGEEGKAKNGELNEDAITTFFTDIEAGKLLPVEEPDELDEMDEEAEEGAEPNEDQELDDMDKEL